MSEKQKDKFRSLPPAAQAHALRDLQDDAEETDPRDLPEACQWYALMQKERKDRKDN